MFYEPSGRVSQLFFVDNKNKLLYIVDLFKGWLNKVNDKV